MTSITSSSFDPKWRYIVIFATSERSMMVSTPTARTPCLQISVYAVSSSPLAGGAVVDDAGVVADVSLAS